MAEISLAAEKIGEIAGWPVTNTMVTAWFATVILAVVSILATRDLRWVPGRLQTVFEWLIEGSLKLAEEVMGQDKLARKALPLTATFFIFILTANWLGLLPGYGAFGWREVHEGKEVLVPFLRSTNADLNTTLALALISVVATQLFGIWAVGFFKYWRRFLNLAGPINFFVGLLEAFSEAAKVFSFSFRLFGNIFAGEVLLVVVGVLVPYLVPLPFYGLELFVGFIQALVFAMLTLVFIKVATLAAEH